MTASQTIGEKIRFMRLKKGLSQEELAFNAKINTSYLGQIERGDKNPTINTLDKIAQGLNMSLEQIISSSDKDEKRPVESKSVLTLLTHDEIKSLISDAIKSSYDDKHNANQE